MSYPNSRSDIVPKPLDDLNKQNQQDACPLQQKSMENIDKEDHPLVRVDKISEPQTDELLLPVQIAEINTPDQIFCPNVEQQPLDKIFENNKILRTALEAFHENNNKRHNEYLTKIIHQDQIIHRAHDAFQANIDKRENENRTRQEELQKDQNKISRANGIIKDSGLNIALPFVQEETKCWKSWSKMDESRWKAPVILADVDGSEGFSGDQWVEFSADGGPLYKIVFKKSPLTGFSDDKYSHATIILFVEGEEVLGMGVERDFTNEFDIWHFSSVRALRVGPWIEGFIDFYNRLKLIKAREFQDFRSRLVRDQAARIDLGSLDGQR